jgi:hypothetical protein
LSISITITDLELDPAIHENDAGTSFPCWIVSTFSWYPDVVNTGENKTNPDT